MADAEIISIGRNARQDPPSGAERPRCAASTAAGNPCRNFAVTPAGSCKVHSRQDEAKAQHPSGHGTAGTDIPSVPSDQGDLEAFIRRRLAGDYPIDDFGYDEELTRQVLMPLIRPLYERYFRVRTLGVDRIPESGPALLIANHSGTIPLDSVLMQYAVGAEHPQKRLVRSVGADLVWQSPVIGHLARKSGNVVACDEDTIELLRRGELVGVFPEGFKGVGKGWRERYKLQRFGRGGFIEVALRTGVPIIPVAIVGAEEAYPMLGNAKTLAKILGFPYFPITATFPWLGPLGLLPLPSRWIIEFGDPIPMGDYPADAADDAMLVFDLSDRIRDTIQQMIYENLNRRGGAFL
ncbi:MAG: lysophospholipid acyltransferase family protein [Actinomycetota bacterium]